MEELKPCPFCGGEAQVVAKPYEPKFCVGCGDDACLGFSGLGWLYETEEQAAAAWNRRAERTCHDEAGSQQSFLCSGCGWFWNDQEDELGFSYCPNCGAKVMA